MPTSAADFDGLNPTVWLGYAAATALDRVPWFQVVDLIKKVGEEPSRVRLRYVPAHYDEEDPPNIIPEDHDYVAGQHPGPLGLAILYHNGYELKPGMRIVITSDYEGTIPIFVGMLMNRIGSSDPDELLWECVDDRWMLGGKGGITIRGAIVSTKDPAGGMFAAQYCSAYLPVFNPGGMYNCIGVKMSFAEEEDVLVPVFAPQAIRPKDWNDTPPALQEGVLTAWTPRLALEYLCLVLNLNASSEYYGIKDNTEWRTIFPNVDSYRVYYNYNYVKTNFHAYANGSTVDDLADKRMQELTIQGKKATLAICDVLRGLGTHVLALYPIFDPGSGTAAQYGVSGIYFLPKGVHKDDIAYDLPAVPLVLPQSGHVEDYYDGPNGDAIVQSFRLTDNAEESAEATLTEGDAIEVETSFEYNPIATDYPDSQVLPAWSADEQTAFLTVINGGDANYVSANKPAYAVYPDSPDNLTFVAPGGTNGWITADGQTVGPATHEFARRCSKEAVALARKLFPKVFRAFRIFATDEQLYATPLELFNQDWFPRLKTPRIINARQSQPFIRTLTDANVGDYENKIIEQLPIRIRVRALDELGNEKWTEAFSDFKLSQTQDGLVWIDGLAEEVDGADWCLYRGHLTREPATGAGSPWTVNLRWFKINATMKLDHRVYGKKDLAASLPVFDQTLRDAMGGPPMQYIDSGETYKMTYQLNSEPSAFPLYQTNGTATITSPISRILPPGDGNTQADKSAERRAYWASRIKRDGKWTLPGIRLQYYAGAWVNEVTIEGNPSQLSYPINAPIQTVTFRFTSPQTTEIGGFIQDDQ